MGPKKPLTDTEALSKLMRFCAYQERSQQQARDKLYTYGLHRDKVEEVITTLITEGFINEERFAVSYARGKFSIKKWGRIKILQGLKQHHLSSYCINKALEQIEEKDYLNTLHTHIEQKQKSLNEKNPFIEKQKIARFAIGKGFEPELVWQVLGTNQLH